jgi:hypothetical protein
VLYSRARLAAPVAAGLLVGAGLLAWGVVQAVPAAIGGGAFALVLSGLFALATRGKRERGAVALARAGPLLVGEELDRPLPVAETTFELRSDFEGAWVIVLRCRGESARLASGGWRIAGERRITKQLARSTLLALGLREAGQ